ncbi:hypothetical protein [Rhizobium leguminosarum]|uniref:hypothetical protein n=1 Tax=Rhizobium leguminosarum TaxID=384 RepID=UPI000DE4EC96
MHAQRQDLSHFLKSLHGTFGSNLSRLNGDFIGIIEAIDTENRAISDLGNVIRSSYSTPGPHCEHAAKLIDEVFSDVAQAMYLISCGLIVPGRMVTRRAFEIGLSIAFLWDQPHEYWSWAEHDADLSFTAMVNYLSSHGYQSHIKKLHSENAPAFNISEAQSLYRTLSNTVHGKIDLLPPLSPERFDITTNGAEEHINALLRVTVLVRRTLDTRFPKTEE